MAILAIVNWTRPSLLGDMYPNKEGEEEPDWVKSEREQFSQHRDTNKDGKMDKDEVQKWIIPDDYDHSDSEAKHLIHESDDDKVDVTLCLIIVYHLHC